MRDVHGISIAAFDGRRVKNMTHGSLTGGYTWHCHPASDAGVILPGTSKIHVLFFGSLELMLNSFNTGPQRCAQH